MSDKFYTIEQIARMLGMHHKTIRRFIAEGKLAANKVGKQWRITGHDLSVFVEKNSEGADRIAEENRSVEYASEEESNGADRKKINVSSVIDIPEISPENYMRVSNTLIAITNCKDPDMGNATINVKYYEKEKKLRVILWGSVKFAEEMLNSIRLLTEPDKL